MATAFKKLNKARQAVGKAEESSDESIDSQASQSGDEGQVKQENVSTSAKDVQESAEEEVETKPKVFDEQEGLMAFKDPDPASREWKNRQRTLILCSRGIAGPFRHLVEDLTNLLPNTKKEQRVDRKNVKDIVDDLCHELSCNNFLFFEQHKQKDLFMWMSKSPSGPSIKFLVTNIHSQNDPKLTGNCLKYSRPLLSFDKGFEQSPHTKLIKEVIHQIFNTPKNHPKSKPFIDHVLSFNMHENKIWFRAYQIMNQYEEKFTEKDDIEKLLLIEIGPRMTL